MATLLQARPAVRENEAIATTSSQLLLLASDGSEAAESATRVAAALSSATGAQVRVVSVLLPQLYPPPAYESGIGVTMSTSMMESDLAQRVSVIGRQRSEVTTDEWPIDIEVGPAAAIIAREARRRNASMVVMGLRPHKAIDRWLRDETALRVVRESPVPVLAVTASLTGLPKRIAVAVDFSRASLRAARAAVHLLAPGGTLSIVYVRPRVGQSEEAEGASFIQAQGVAGAFARLRKELSVPRGIAVDAVILEGQAAPELLSFAERADIDLIAVGSHRHPFLSRMLIGSVTSAVVRSARCSLLVAPPTSDNV